MLPVSCDRLLCALRGTRRPNERRCFGAWLGLTLRGNESFDRVVRRHELRLLDAETRVGVRARGVKEAELPRDEAQDLPHADSAFYDGPPLKTDVTYPTRGAAEQMVEPSEGQFASIRKKSDFVEALAKTEDNKRYSPRIFALKEHEKRAKQIYSTYSDKMEEK